jgi:hypothetical protein
LTLQDIKTMQTMMKKILLKRYWIITDKSRFIVAQTAEIRFNTS